jgi:hypothetical protein
MYRNIGFIVLALAPIAAVVVDQAAAQQQPARTGTFFITSNASGTGDVGGLAGADKICQQLAKALPGGANRTWRAYLSTTGQGAVNARDRIGNGPWYNVKGVLIAQNVAELHSDKANINNDTALDEMGRTINMQGAPNPDRLDGRGPTNRHDLYELDQQWPRHCDARPSRSPGAWDTGLPVERGACVAGVLGGESARHRRGGAALLLRGQLTHHRHITFTHDGHDLRRR